MSAPTFLNSTFRYFDRDGVVDVQTTMDDFAVEAAANSWTSLGGGLYKSPVDGDGRWFDVLLTRIAATKLEWRVRDQLGNTICTRRAQLVAGGTGIIFVGQYHVQIEFDSGAGYECLLAGILDQSPEAQSSNNRYVFGHGWRTTLDALDSNCAVSKPGMMDNATASIATDRITMYRAAVAQPDALFTMGGTRILRPIGLWTKPAGEASYYRFHGRRYQALLVESSLPYKTRITVPIDAGLSAVFQVAGSQIIGSVRPAIRVA